jgi:hypothetical protein
VVDGGRMNRRRAVEDWGHARVEQALESLEDAITLLEWRYSHEADPSIARLERIREELRTALLLAGSSSMHLH